MARSSRSQKPKQYPSMRASDSGARSLPARNSRLRTLLILLVVCATLLLGLHVRRAWVRYASLSSASKSSLGAPLMDSAAFASALGLAPQVPPTPSAPSVPQQQDDEPQQHWAPDDPYRPLTTEDIQSFSMDDIQSMFDFIHSEVDFEQVSASNEEPRSGGEEQALEGTQERAERFGRLRAAMGGKASEHRTEL